MKEAMHSTQKYAICVNNWDYPASLELHKLYRIVPDEDARLEGDLRIVDESGEDYLYPADYFLVVEFPQVILQALQGSFEGALQAA
ncbi:MAG: hypothetical protein K1X65_04560 [Caldilineales bacterium]|nr:hypothetical protein [Caldilineales bacterium]MCW5858603.1 hypothetical protein [Caldilineales bacterium]